MRRVSAKLAEGGGWRILPIPGVGAWHEILRVKTHASPSAWHARQAGNRPLPLAVQAWWHDVIRRPARKIDVSEMSLALLVCERHMDTFSLVEKSTVARIAIQPGRLAVLLALMELGLPRRSLTVGLL